MLRQVSAVCSAGPVAVPLSSLLAAGWPSARAACGRHSSRAVPLSARTSPVHFIRHGTDERSMIPSDSLFHTVPRHNMLQTGMLQFQN